MRHVGFRGPAAVSALAALVMAPLAASAQSEPRYAEEPTGGLHLPAQPLAGEHDAFSPVTNPAGTRLLRGFHASLGIDLESEDHTTSTGPGVGLYMAGPVGGGLLPTVGLGAGVEFLRPNPDALDPDPGSPTRFTLAAGMGLGRNTAVGLAWHAFSDDPSEITRGLRTWDLGLSTRVGAHVAFGAVVRDLNAPVLAGMVPVQRRYEAELVMRPTGTERLELAVGGRIGEIRADVDGWLRWSARLARGVYFEGEAVTRALHALDPALPGAMDTAEREYRLSAGLELSLGSMGAAVYGTGVRGPDGESSLAGSTLILRVSSEQVPSVLGRSQRIERIELAGELGERGLASTLLHLRALVRDPGVVAVFVQLDGPSVGWASAQELRQAFLALRKAGKRVFVYLVAGTTRDYFLASAADRIYLDPAGGLRLVGFAGTTLYFKGVFDKLGVNAEFEKIEEYKSAPEAYTQTGPSEQALAMRNELYDTLYANLVAGIAQGRGLGEAVVRELIDGGPYTAGDLRKGKAKVLVDAIATPDEVGQLLVKELGQAYPVAAAPRERPTQWALPAIAVITIEGDIIDGKSSTVPLLGMKLVGGETIATAIAAARFDPRIKAIVLRINSPGGSAVASEMMSREVFKTRGIKPIICSMGDVAASGGYFAAAGCDLVLAEPMTITGSIGIFYGKFDLSGLLAKTGLSWYTLQRGAKADMESYFHAYAPEDRALIKEKMRYLYGRFIEAVAQGRGMSQEQVDTIGRGRVWSGARAREIKLVDRLGGLDDAITLAKQRAGLGEDQRAEVVWLPENRAGLIQRLLGLSSALREQGRGDTAQRAAELALPPALRALMAAVPGSLWVQPQAPQARLPFSILWQ